MVTYEVWLSDPLGNRVALLDGFYSLEAVRIANQPGACSLVLPSKYDDLFRLDSLIEVWRRNSELGSPRLFNVYMVRGWELSERDNEETTTLRGWDGLSLLGTRWVAYATDSSQAAKTDEADDLAKAIVRENCTSAATDADRAIAGLTVASNASAAPSITMHFAYRRVGDVLYDIAEASRKEGTRLYYDLVPVASSTGGISFEFRTAIHQPGQDLSGVQQVFFGREWGNMADVRVTYDYSQEATVVYALGRGLQGDREVVEVEDAARSGASPYGRRETAYNVSGQASTTAAYTAAGKARLEELRPRARWSGTILDSTQAQFGRDWNFGDRVMVTSRRQQAAAVITSLMIRVRGGGAETLSGTFEVV